MVAVCKDRRAGAQRRRMPDRKVWPGRCWPAAKTSTPQLGSTAAPGCGWPRPRGKLRADVKGVPRLGSVSRGADDGGVAGCARGRARSPRRAGAQRRQMPGRKVCDRPLVPAAKTSTPQGAGEWPRIPALNYFVLTLALTCILSPGERISPATLFVCSNGCPINPALGFSKEAGNVKALSSEERVG